MTEASTRAGPSRDSPIVWLPIALLLTAVPFFYRQEVLGELLAPLVGATAWAVRAAIDWLGLDVAQSGAVLASPAGFAYEIQFRCTGFLPVLFLVTAIAFQRAPLGRRVAAAIGGSMLLLALNLVRLVHLFMVGLFQAHLFDLMHMVFWEAVIVLAVILLWTGFLAWSRSAAPGSALAATS